MDDTADVCILISAGAEWRALLPFFTKVILEKSPYGEYFFIDINGQRCCFLHSGWGKVASAGSTQFAVDHWRPQRIINLGTCGGFKSYIDLGKIILAQKTIIYDIFEQMSDPDQAIERYSVTFDLSWLPDPPPRAVSLGTLLTADRDINPAEISDLISKYQAYAADWESGAIAWVAQRNNLPCLILRAVSDLVDPKTSQAYGDYAFYESQCQGIMADFFKHIPGWIRAFNH